MVAPIEELVGSPAFAAPTSEPRASNVDGTGFSDMEASVFRKLQEVLKMKIRKKRLFVATDLVLQFSLYLPSTFHIFRGKGTKKSVFGIPSSFF